MKFEIKRIWQSEMQKKMFLSIRVCSVFWDMLGKGKRYKDIHVLFFILL